MCAGDCGVPESLTNGTVAYTATTEGSLAIFQCSAGLVPGEVMTAVCEESGGVARWSPNPGDLNCTKPESFPGQGIMIELFLCKVKCYSLLITQGRQTQV